MLKEQQQRQLVVWVVSAVAVVVGVLLGGVIDATAQTLAWDPSPDASVAGYRVRYGANAAALDATVDAGARLEVPLSWWPRDVVWFLCVEAYDRDLRTGPCSDFVVLTPSIDGTLGRRVETYEEWTSRFSPGPGTDDPDGDGVSNADEYAAQTDPFIPNRWLFAEGGTPLV